MSTQYRIELEFENVGFCGEGKTGVPGEKPLRARNQQQTQLTYDAGSGNRTRDSLVGGERSHQYAIPAPLALHVYYSCDTVCLELQLAKLCSLLCHETDWNIYIGKQGYFLS